MRGTLENKKQEEAGLPENLKESELSFYEVENVSSPIMVINYEKDNQDYYFFTLNNRDFILTKGKIGKVATGFHIGKITSEYNIKRIYNLGTSGAYNSSLNIGDAIPYLLSNKKLSLTSRTLNSLYKDEK